MHSQPWLFIPALDGTTIDQYLNVVRIGLNNGWVKQGTSNLETSSGLQFHTLYEKFWKAGALKNIPNPSEIFLKIFQNFLVYNNYLGQWIILKFCTEYGTITVVFCV